MLNIKKEDIVKTVVIIWFLLATGYVVWDQYQEYKVRGIQAAYQAGYSSAVDQLISQTQTNGCAPFEVHKDEKKVNIVNGDCLQAQQNQQEQAVKGQQIIRK